jgi:hypothetical protein
MKKVQIAGKWAIAAVAAVCTLFAPEATACSSPETAGRSAGLRGPMVGLESAMDRLLPPLQTAITGSQDAKDANSQDRNSEIVGMWLVAFYIGNTTQLYDQGLQQFYSDGNEMTNSSFFPPVEGSICFGVWQTVGTRTFKLKHIGWTFANGNFAGTFRLTATLIVNPQGDAYVGTYVADIVDASGNVISGSQGKGVVKGRRFRAD